MLGAKTKPPSSNILQAEMLYVIKIMLCLLSRNILRNLKIFLNHHTMVKALTFPHADEELSWETGICSVPLAGQSSLPHRVLPESSLHPEITAKSLNSYGFHESCSATCDLLEHQLCVCDLIFVSRLYTLLLFVGAYLKSSDQVHSSILYIRQLRQGVNYTFMFAENTGSIKNSICESHLNFQTWMWYKWQINMLGVGCAVHMNVSLFTCWSSVVRACFGWLSAKSIHPASLAKLSNQVIAKVVWYNLI